MTRTAAGAGSRALAGLLSGAVAVATLVLGAPPAEAAEPDRLAGPNRYATAAAIAAETFPAGASDVVLATGRDFPDALAASGIAGALRAPVLLTATGSLPTETAAALDSLGANMVHIVGGTTAVRTQVQTAIEAAGYGTRRLAGDNRYATAAKVAEAMGAGDVAEATAIIATGSDFPDALAGGPLAYAGPHPILLVDDDVPEPTQEALVRLGVTDIVILGETAAVSREVAEELARITGDPDPVRLGGRTRDETAAEVARYAVAHHGFTASTILLAGGVGLAGVDALAGGTHGGVLKTPILPVMPDRVPGGTRGFLTDNAADIGIVRALGGPIAIHDSTLAAAVAAATPATPVDDIPPTAVSGEVAIGDRAWVITFSEPIDAASLTCADITVPEQSEYCTNVTLGEGDTVATVTFNNRLGGDEVLTLAAGSVIDLAGNLGPPEPLLAVLPPHMEDAVLSGEASATLVYSQCVTTRGGTTPDPAEFSYDADGVAGGDIPAVTVALDDPTATCGPGSSRTLAIEFAANVVPDAADALPNDAIRYTDSEEAPDAGDIVSMTGVAVPDELERLD